MEILCTKSSKINNYFKDSNVIKYTDGNFQEILQNIAKYSSWEERNDELENNPDFKQIIPYFVFKTEDQIFTYKRLPKSGEQRLVDKYSVGIGGHVDCPENINFETYCYDEILESSVIRELSEEIVLTERNSWDYVDLAYLAGIINDNSTPVNSVHLGLVFICEIDDVEKDEIIIREEDKLEGEWMKIEDVKNLNLEDWTKIVLDHLI